MGVGFRGEHGCSSQRTGEIRADRGLERSSGHGLFPNRGAGRRGFCPQRQRDCGGLAQAGHHGHSRFGEGDRVHVHRTALRRDLRDRLLRVVGGDSLRYVPRGRFVVDSR